MDKCIQANQARGKVGAGGGICNRVNGDARVNRDRGLCYPRDAASPARSCVCTGKLGPNRWRCCTIHTAYERWGSIPAIVYPAAMTDDMAKLIEISENLIRTELTKTDRLKAEVEYARLLDKLGAFGKGGNRTGGEALSGDGIRRIPTNDSDCTNAPDCTNGSGRRGGPSVTFITIMSGDDTVKRSRLYEEFALFKKQTGYEGTAATATGDSEEAKATREAFNVWKEGLADRREWLDRLTKDKNSTIEAMKPRWAAFAKANGIKGSHQDVNEAAKAAFVTWLDDAEKAEAKARPSIAR